MYMVLVGYKYHKSVRLHTWGMLLSFMIFTIIVILLWFYLKHIMGRATPFFLDCMAHTSLLVGWCNSFYPPKCTFGGGYNLLAKVGTCWVHISNVSFECYVDSVTLLDVQVRDVKCERLPFLAASHMSLSAPSAKLNVAGAYFSFGGGENNLSIC